MAFWVSSLMIICPSLFKLEIFPFCALLASWTRINDIRSRFNQFSWVFRGLLFRRIPLHRWRFFVECQEALPSAFCFLIAWIDGIHSYLHLAFGWLSDDRLFLKDESGYYRIWLRRAWFGSVSTRWDLFMPSLISVQQWPSGSWSWLV